MTTTIKAKDRKKKKDNDDMFYSLNAMGGRPTD